MKKIVNQKLKKIIIDLVENTIYDRIDKVIRECGCDQSFTLSPCDIKSGLINDKEFMTPYKDIAHHIMRMDDPESEFRHAVKLIKVHGPHTAKEIIIDDNNGDKTITVKNDSELKEDYSEYIADFIKNNPKSSYALGMGALAAAGIGANVARGATQYAGAKLGQKLFGGYDVNVKNKKNNSETDINNSKEENKLTSDDIEQLKEILKSKLR